MKEKLSQLDNELKEFEKKLGKDARSKQAKRSKDAGTIAGFSGALRILSEFISAILVSFALGWAFDKLFGTGVWGIIFFVFLGFFAGVFNILRTAGKFSSSFSASNKLDTMQSNDKRKDDSVDG